MSPIFFNWQFRLIVETWKKMLGCIFLIGIYNKIRDLFAFPNTNLALDFSKNIFGGKKELTIKSLFVQCTTTVLPSPAAPGIPLILLGPCAVSVSLNICGGLNTVAKEGSFAKSWLSCLFNSDSVKAFG